MKPDRWLLTVEFDSIAEVIASGSYEGARSEAEKFDRYIRRQATEYWGFIDKELDQCVAISGDTVEVTLNVLDPFDKVFRWIISHSIPKSLKLERTENR